MALGGALVDKAWIVRREPKAAEDEWVDGEKQMTPLPADEGPTKHFRCRFQLLKGVETQEQGRRRRVVRPMLLIGRRNVLIKGDKVKIRSKQQDFLALYGTEEPIFQVNGDPEPLRKRRTVIGWEASLVLAN